MKKFLMVLICLMLSLSVSSCITITPRATDEETADSQETTENVTTAGATTIEPTSGETTAAVTSAGGSTTAASSSETGVSPSNSAEMYSSYAHMVTYDPARGWADFDYFIMLRGDEAVEFLVENEGYTEAEAREMVDNFADSEFVEKNVNPQLRTIDLREIELKLMYHPDGTQVEGAEPVDAELIDLYNLYELDPDKVLHSFFYYVTCENGVVVSVEQVYWP